MSTFRTSSAFIMRNAKHIDELLKSWEYDPYSVNARIVPGEDGRELIQMRIDMGLLQLETSGRPDGHRPEGEESYYDHLLSRIMAVGDDFLISESDCAEIDREFVQYYHRRICWLELRRFDRAVEDADHTLGLMDLCNKHSPDEHWTLTHEQYRRFVLFHRTHAAALAQLDAGHGPEAAVTEFNNGIDRMREVYAGLDSEEEFDEDELVQRLTEMREELRREYAVGRTLQEQLDDAVAAEKYELAARLRDELESRIEFE